MSLRKTEVVVFEPERQACGAFTDAGHVLTRSAAFKYLGLHRGYHRWLCQISREVPSNCMKGYEQHAQALCTDQLAMPALHLQIV